jgi:catechol 2,3-dioxygenase-like lactoylglutathione lyase family enzyme
MKATPLIKFHSAAAFVADIEKSKAFYTGILGQEIDLDFGKNVVLKCGLTLWEIQPEHIIPSSLGNDSVSNRTVNRFEFYFEVEAIEGIAGKLKTAGVELLHPVREEPWGQRTIRFFDPDRHLIEIGEPLDVFIRRMIAGGMTPETVSAKTGVPPDKIKEFAA